MDGRHEYGADEKNFQKNILPAARFDAFDFDSVLWACYLCAGRRKCESGRFVFLSAYALIITVTGITDVVRFVRQGIDRYPLVKKALDIPVVGRL